MIIFAILAGALVGLVIGTKLESYKWRKASETPYIRILSYGKFYHVLSDQEYDDINPGTGW